jgi:tRNA pseudouridine55 synthase
MDAVLIMDKPARLTSHDVVARVRRILGERRVGHTGTLDPFATGVLVMLTGRATRLAQFLSNAVKEYEAVVRFGYATDTGDVTGARLETPRAQKMTREIVHALDEREIEQALSGLRGQIEQVPPMYSAKKLQGRKLYELARRGIEVGRKGVRVTIHELEAVKRDGMLLQRNADGTCDLQLRVVCSAGTYVRTLAESLGERLRTPAHLLSLRRTRAGDFRIEEALTLDELKAKVEAGQSAAAFLSPDAALSWMPFVHLTADEARQVRHGMALPLKKEVEWLDNEPIRMRAPDGRLIAIGSYDAAAGILRPRVVLPPEK